MTSQVPEDTPDEETPDEAAQEATAEAAPEQPEAATPRRPRTRWIAALAFVVVAALIAGIAWLLRPQPESSAVPAATPQQAVAGYLEALVATDADRALEYALNRPTDTTLLTRAVLEASHQQGRLTVVNVPEVGEGENVTVPAEIKLGDRATTITFAVTRTEAGWRLAQVTSTIDPGPLPGELGATPLPLTASVCGLPAPLLVTVIVALRVPVAAGVKVIVSAQLAPGATVVQVPAEAANSVGTLLATPEIVTGLPPTLVTGTFSGAPAVPTR